MGRKVKCFVENCGNTNLSSDVHFYHFPKPGKADFTRCRIWAEFARPSEIWDKEDKLKKLFTSHAHICGIHFKPDDFKELEPTRLRIHAIPRVAPALLGTEASGPTESSSSPVSSSSCHVSSELSSPPPPSSSVPSSSSSDTASETSVPTLSSVSSPSSIATDSATTPEVTGPTPPSSCLPSSSKTTCISFDIPPDSNESIPSTPTHPNQCSLGACGDTPNMDVDNEPQVSTPGRSNIAEMVTPTLGSKVATRKRKRTAARRSLLQQINVTRLNHLTPRKKLLVHSCRRKDREVTRLKKEYEALKEKTSISNVMELSAFKKLPDALKLIMEATLRCTSCKPNGRRWTVEEKLQSLALFKNSPRSYRLLRHLFPLPSGRTLRTLLSRIPFTVGVNKQVLKSLGESLKNYDPKDRNVTLIFDEMAIRKCMSWNGQLDQVDGFQDHGSQGRSKKVAEQALVFMIQGLRKKYKQPVAYYFSNGSVSGERMSTLIKEVIKATEDAGFKVRTTVCDMGGNNVKALELLGSTYDKPYFEFNGHRIYTIYDVCHLLKCTRNNFQTKDVKFTVSVKGKRYTGAAKWKHIKQVVHEDRKRVFRSLRHIKNKHLNPRGAQKMKVNLAAQIFSKTMASNVENQHAYGILKGDESAILTSCMCGQFDEVFDALNGQGTIPYKGKCLRTRMDDNSPHIKQLIKAQKFISSMNYEGHTSTNRPPSQNGWLATIRATRMLWDDLKKEGFTYIETKRLNSDPIECQFGQIRCNCGGNNQRPNVPQFVGAFKTSILNNTTAQNLNGNCEFENIGLLNDLRVLLMEYEENAKAEEVVETLVNQVDMELGPILARSARLKAAIKDGDNESRPIAHIAGFVAKHIISKMKCDKCCNRLLTTSDEPCNSLIKAKEYNPEKKSLTYCCAKFVETVGSSLYYCDDMIEKYPHIGKIKATITKKLKEKFFLQWLISVCCKTEHAKKMVTLFCDTIFHITIKWWCQRKNRAFATEKSDKLQAKRKMQILKHK